MLSKNCAEIPHKYNITIVQVKKLVPILKDKEVYILQFRNLQVHLNTNKRTNPKNLFDKDFLSLMNNRVFGKNMENIRKRVKINL